MVAYRFCRPDDVPRLVAAVNQCFAVHFPAHPALTVEDFQREVRQLNVWPSNCMVASVKDDPIAVSIAARRDSEVLLHRIGVRPGHLREGHGSHLLNSLSQKLAVLGPPRIVAEVPATDTRVRLFFESAGFRSEVTYTDFLLHSPLPETSNAGALIPIRVDELLENQLLPQRFSVSWERQRETLVNRKDEIQGIAAATPDSIDAFLLFRDTPGMHMREIVHLAFTAEFENADQRRALQTILLRCACSKTDKPVLLPKVTAEEIEFEHLESLGFTPGQSYIRFAAAAGD